MASDNREPKTTARQGQERMMELLKKIRTAQRHGWSVHTTYHDRDNSTWFVILEPMWGGKRIQFSACFGGWFLA